jgi:hypothetical protein
MAGLHCLAQTKFFRLIVKNERHRRRKQRHWQQVAIY